MNNFPHLMSFIDDVNAVLNQLANEGTLEPMAEPIDEPNCCPFDYAEATGLFDEIWPEPMVDENGILWYTH